MSTSSTEPNAQGHPAYQEILDSLPESLRPLILPKLEAMDKGVQDKLQATQGMYDPYKKFVDGKIDPQVIEQSLYIANMLQQDPEGFVKRAIENFNIESFKQAPVSQEPEVDDLSNWDGEDISKHPVVKQLMDQVSEMRGTQQTWQQQQEQAKYEKDLEAYLDSLETEHGDFDRLYVSAMLANNVDGPQAVKQYQDMVNAAALKLTNPDGTQQVQQQQGQQTVTPPVVMGAAGTAGSGSPNEPVNMGAMKDGDVQDMVLQMLAQAAANEQ